MVKDRNIDRENKTMGERNTSVLKLVKVAWEGGWSGAWEGGA